MWTLGAFWNFIWGWSSIANLIGLAAVAIAVLLPPWVARFVPNLRTVAVCVAIGAFSFSVVAGKYYNDGLKYKQAEWDRAEKAQAKKVDGAVSGSRSDVSHGVRDPYDRDEY
ncbi:hypothetical protein [Pseudolabrys sp.]|uniref:hypothetical protein n=1 Tax=Pseudolabrys sp. TaxID=1960880 RepID=UPI003D0FAC51